MPLSVEDEKNIADATLELQKQAAALKAEIATFKAMR
jgi:hypothetical protein